MTPTTDERNPTSESPGGTFLMTPEQHRARAARVRAQGLEELAQGHENVAKMIERRLARPSGPGQEAVRAGIVSEARSKIFERGIEVLNLSKG
jgi:hypothetical protein